MKRVLTAVVLVPLVLLTVWKAPWPYVLALCCVVALLCTREYLALLRGLGIAPMTAAAYLFQVAAFVMAAVWMHHGGVFTFHVLAPFIFLMIAPIALGATLLLAMRRAALPEAFNSAVLSAAALPYLGMPFACIAALREDENGFFWVLFLFAVVWIGDAAAYYAGRTFGRRLLAPRISPKKTWEGTIASVVGSVVAANLLLHVAKLQPPEQFLDHPLRWPFISFMAIVVNVAAQFGDLTESMIKRAANVKDSGTLLPGHGGILDRVDALLFAAPVLWYFWAFYFVVTFS